MAEKHRRPTRSDTDSGLGSERRKTDEELAKRVSQEEAEADAVSTTARGQAAEILRKARKEADDTLGKNDPPVPPRAVIEDARRQQDEDLQREYARADKIARGDRRERARLVAALLEDVRIETDRRLL